MSTLTLAQSDNIPSIPSHSRSPSPNRNLRSENSDNCWADQDNVHQFCENNFKDFGNIQVTSNHVHSQMVKIHSEQTQDLDHFLDTDQGPDPSIIHNK